MVLESEELYVFALDADQQLLGPDQEIWLERLEQKWEPLQALLEQFVAARDIEGALRLSAALARFCWMRGHTPAGRAWLQRVLSLPGGSDEARAKILVGAGSLAYAAGDFRGAWGHYKTLLPLLRISGRELDLADALDRAGMAARQLMRLADAQTLHTEALEIQRRLGTPAEQALCLNNLGVVLFFRGDLDAAQAYHEEALGLREQVGDVRGKASSLNNLGQVARFAGDLVAARAFMEQGLLLRQQLGDRWGVAGSQVNLAAIHVCLGDLAAARVHLREAAAGFRAVEDPLGHCECLEAAAELAHAEGRLAEAVRFFSAALFRRERLPAPHSPVLERAVVERLSVLRKALKDEAFDEAWGEGRDICGAVLQQFE
jgi:Tfp pilus assembly protein PilF